LGMFQDMFYPFYQKVRKEYWLVIFSNKY
jgi:hypothetical protein